MSLDVCLRSKACPHCGHSEVLWDGNVTHNLVPMAQEANLYSVIWNPESIGITKAEELIAPLRAGLALMMADPSRFEQHNPDNGWGNYVNFVQWIKNYLLVCEKNPDAEISTNR